MKARRERPGVTAAEATAGGGRLPSFISMSLPQKQSQTEKKQKNQSQKKKQKQRQEKQKKPQKQKQQKQPKQPPQQQEQQEIQQRKQMRRRGLTVPVMPNLILLQKYGNKYAYKPRTEEEEDNSRSFRQKMGDWANNLRIYKPSVKRVATTVTAASFATKSCHQNRRHPYLRRSKIATVASSVQGGNSMILDKSMATGSDTNSLDKKIVDSEITFTASSVTEGEEKLDSSSTAATLETSTSLSDLSSQRLHNRRRREDDHHETEPAITDLSSSATKEQPSEATDNIILLGKAITTTDDDVHDQADEYELSFDTPYCKKKEDAPSTVATVTTVATFATASDTSNQQRSSCETDTIPTVSSFTSLGQLSAPMDDMLLGRAITTTDDKNLDPEDELSLDSASFKKSRKLRTSSSAASLLTTSTDTSNQQHQLPCESEINTSTATDVTSDNVLLGIAVTTAYGTGSSFDDTDDEGVRSLDGESMERNMADNPTKAWNDIAAELEDHSKFLVDNLDVSEQSGSRRKFHMDSLDVSEQTVPRSNRTYIVDSLDISEKTVPRSNRRLNISDATGTAMKGDTHDIWNNSPTKKNDKTLMGTPSAKQFDDLCVPTQKSLGTETIAKGRGISAEEDNFVTLSLQTKEDIPPCIEDSNTSISKNDAISMIGKELLASTEVYVDEEMSANGRGLQLDEDDASATELRKNDAVASMDASIDAPALAAGCDQEDAEATTSDSKCIVATTGSSSSGAKREEILVRNASESEDQFTSRIQDSTECIVTNDTISSLKNDATLRGDSPSTMDGVVLSNKNDYTTSDDGASQVIDTACSEDHGKRVEEEPQPGSSCAEKPAEVKMGHRENEMQTMAEELEDETNEEVGLGLVDDWFARARESMKLDLCDYESEPETGQGGNDEMDLKQVDAWFTRARESMVLQSTDSQIMNDDSLSCAKSATLQSFDGGSTEEYDRPDSKNDRDNIVIASVDGRRSEDNLEISQGDRSFASTKVEDHGVKMLEKPERFPEEKHFFSMLGESSFSSGRGMIEAVEPAPTKIAATTIESESAIAMPPNTTLTIAAAAIEEEQEQEQGKVTFHGFETTTRGFEDDDKAQLCGNTLQVSEDAPHLKGDTALDLQHDLVEDNANKMLEKQEKEQSERFPEEKHFLCMLGETSLNSAPSMLAQPKQAAATKLLESATEVAATATSSEAAAAPSTGDYAAHFTGDAALAIKTDLVEDNENKMLENLEIQPKRFPHEKHCFSMLGETSLGSERNVHAPSDQAARESEVRETSPLTTESKTSAALPPTTATTSFAATKEQEQEQEHGKRKITAGIVGKTARVLGDDDGAQLCDSTLRGCEDLSVPPLKGDAAIGLNHDSPVELKALIAPCGEDETITDEDESIIPDERAKDEYNGDQSQGQSFEDGLVLAGLDAGRSQDHLATSQSNNNEQQEEERMKSEICSEEQRVFDLLRDMSFSSGLSMFAHSEQVAVAVAAATTTSRAVKTLAEATTAVAKTQTEAKEGVKEREGQIANEEVMDKKSVKEDNTTLDRGRLGIQDDGGQVEELASQLNLGSIEEEKTVHEEEEKEEQEQSGSGSDEQRVLAMMEEMLFSSMRTINAPEQTAVMPATTGTAGAASGGSVGKTIKMAFEDEQEQEAGDPTGCRIS